MSELTVETTGDFMLLDRYSGREIPAAGSATVPQTPFIVERVELKQLRVLEGELTATPAELPAAPVQEQETPGEPDTTTDAPVQEQAAETPALDLTGTGGLHEALTGETPSVLTGLAAALTAPADADGDLVESDPDLAALLGAADAGGSGVDLTQLSDNEVIERLSTAPVPDRENEIPSTPEVPERENVDADGDGHDDANGQFVDGNQEAAKPAKRGGKRSSK